MGYLIHLGEMLEGRMLYLLFINGVSYFATNSLSFLILHKLPIETHAVGNGLRQLFIILCFLHSSSFKLVNLVGVALTVASSILYIVSMEFSLNALPHSADFASLHEQFAVAQARQKGM